MPAVVPTCKLPGQLSKNAIRKHISLGMIIVWGKIRKFVMYGFQSGPYGKFKCQMPSNKGDKRVRDTYGANTSYKITTVPRPDLLQSQLSTLSTVSHTEPVNTLKLHFMLHVLWGNKLKTDLKGS
jgi:hypothetical protein